MKRLFRFKYPKIILLIAISIFTYWLFKYTSVGSYISNEGRFVYLDVFVAGLLFSFGFTTPFSIGMLLTTHPQNLFIAAIIGGFGALLSDLFIFKTIKFSFLDEFKKLKRTKTIKRIERLILISPLHKVKNYMIFIFAGLIIASPFPDEIAVSMLAGMTKINLKILSLVSFAMNAIGIYILLKL